MHPMQLDLPPPKPGQFLEISFRKLLKSCYDIADGKAPVCKKELVAWRASPLFHYYVETLTEQLEGLRQSPASRVDDAVLQQYQEHVQRLSQQLQEPGTAAAAQPSNDAAQLREARAELFSRLQPDNAASPQAAAVHAANGSQLTGAARRTLTTQEQLQDMITDELVGMAAGMKTNTLAMESQLRHRETLLDDTDAALEHSLQQARKSKQRAKEIHSRNRIGFCKTCLALLLVGCVFTGMYLYIRFTYLIGFKQ